MMQSRPIGQPLATNRAATGRAAMGAVVAGIVGIGMVGAGMVGCSDKPSRIESPNYDPKALAAAAMEFCDKDGDGAIAGDELLLAPSLADANGDGRVSADEIEASVEAWIKSRLGLIPCRVTVTWRGKPLPGAKIEFIPENFMHDQVMAASGTTSADGTTSVSTDEKIEGWPEGRRAPGARCGFYQVKITHPEKSIPAKYNTDTSLGAEVSPAALVSGLFFHLN